MRGRFSRVLAVVAAALSIVADGAAQPAGPPAAVAPATREEFERLLGEAAATAQHIVDLEAEDAALPDRARAVLAERAAHNASPPPATDAGAVARYNAEAARLDGRSQAILARMNALPGELGTKRTHLQVIMARFRIESVLEGLEPWRQRVVACARLPTSIAQATCLRREWERVPPLRRARLRPS